MPELQPDTKNKSARLTGSSARAGPIKCRKIRARYDPGSESKINALMRAILTDYGPPFCAAADCRRHRRRLKPLQPHIGPGSDISMRKHLLPPCVMGEQLHNVISLYRILDVMLGDFERGPPDLGSAAQAEETSASTA